ncbi:MAG: hypothetical protein GIW99_07710 [Candidatus Eremiobacteraeota bacterium]|nr:hypothetical protein [Candidatus Eremiobacteraeota bacterium]MBC5827548.1 hypothetical protein [Candidatus Eremiobacteraeota bacterium]
MARVLLLQFDTDPKCVPIRTALEQVDAEIVEDEPRWPGFFQTVTRERPDTIIIACSKIPSHGREAARYLSEGFNTRNIPLILVGVADRDLVKTREYAPRAQIVTAGDLAAAVSQRLQINV